MKLVMKPKNIRWWFWLITLIFIIAALLGWQPGYLIVILISAVQVVFFLFQEKKISAYPVQIRIVYFLFSLFGLWPMGRFVAYLILLLPGTIMVTFFGRCLIALALKYMPWNKNREMKLN
jgi:hypothetical protein